MISKALPLTLVAFISLLEAVNGGGLRIAGLIVLSYVIAQHANAAAARVSKSPYLEAGRQHVNAIVPVTAWCGYGSSLYFLLTIATELAIGKKTFALIMFLSGILAYESFKNAKKC
ncbi:MAG: hypothetical protein RLZZ324_983 [Candidatus Parcubacteria bacterium]|jgi:hypothetical protein